jgi:hypothetical protein
VDGLEEGRGMGWWWERDEREIRMRWPMRERQTFDEKFSTDAFSLDKCWLFFRCVDSIS